ncbi:MAG: tetratricopeptide repeat protein [Vulcanimicrobiaceae bacterium]
MRNTGGRFGQRWRRLFAGRAAPFPDAAARAVAALERGAHEEAIAACERALLGAPAPPLAALLERKRAVALIALGRREEAIDGLAAALAADECDANALVDLGNLLLEDGDLQDARDFYEAAIRVDPGSALAYRNLAITLRRLGHRGEAVRALRSSARLAAKRPPGRA